MLGNTDELLWRPEEQARQRERAPALAGLLRRLFEAYAPERLGEMRRLGRFVSPGPFR